MGAKRTVDYPPWVEEWRAPGRYIRKIKSGYALFTTRTERDAGGKRKQTTEYLGRITEEDGFIPKEGVGHMTEFQEYGLSHFIWANLRTDIQKHLPSGKGAPLIKLGIIQYVFGSLDEVFLENSRLTSGELDTLVPLSKKISQRQVRNVVSAIELELGKKIPVEEDRRRLVQLLRISVSQKGRSCKGAPGLVDAAREILERYGLMM